MARPAERFIDKLSDQQRAQLQCLWRQDERHRVRCRAHAILLSNNGISVPELCNIFGTSRPTMYEWLDRWEQSGIEGLEDQDHPRRPPILDEQERQMAVDLIEEHPRQPDRAVEEIAERTGKQISRRTLRRIARGAELVWKRMRASAAFRRDEVQFATAKSEIEELGERDRAGEFDLYFFDEAAFSLTPEIPYGWQRIGETIHIPSSKGGSIQTLGFMTLDCDLRSYCVEGTINSDVVVSIFGHFANTLTRPSVVVMDNAPAHTANHFQDQIERWAEQGLALYYLPSYSPELNLIERLWRAIKHRWLPLEAYRSFENLKRCLDEVLIGVGHELNLDFSASVS